MKKSLNVLILILYRNSISFSLGILFSLAGSFSATASLDLNKTGQQHPVTGTVISQEDSSALIGVNVYIKGSTKGTVTDMNGKYTLEVDGPNTIVVFSYVGYLVQEITVGESSVINVTLMPDFAKLEEIVVIGYGTQKKVNLSGAVDVITSEEISNRPVSNVIQALQGLAPNLNIIVGNEGGELGGKPLINIRGYGSINSNVGGSPYILVDGIEQDISNINPEDIENISILKDAAASAIYGARAAFGVILITTKRGKQDGISVNYSNNFSYSAPLHLPKMVNSIKFAEYLNLGSENDGEPPMFQPIIIDQMKKYQAGEIDYWTMPMPWALNLWLEYRGGWANTDWFKVDYKDWVPKSTHNLSLSGGNERSQYYISGSNFTQEGLMRFGKDRYTRNNLNININTKVYKWLRMNLISRYNRINLDRPSYNRHNFYANIARRWPTNGVYLPDGNLWSGGEQNWLQNGGRYVENTNDFTLIPGLEIEPVKGWIIYANYRWRLNNFVYTEHEARVSGTFVDGTSFYLRPNNYYAVNQSDSYYNSPNIYSTFNRVFGNHNFTVLAGYEQELLKYESSYSRKNDLISDEKPSLGTATGKEFASGSKGHMATQSFFSRLNYSYKDKYLLELSGRMDGSSKFEKGHRWGVFPSGSVAYILSKEDYWKPISEYINLLKLRGSFGALGNQDVDNYLYIERLPIYSNPPLAYIIGEDRPNYAGMAALPSPSLTWEKVHTTNMGIDLGFLRNRLTSSFDYFIRNTFDMFGPVESLPAVLGTAVPKSNNATLRTTGFEFLVTWKDSRGDFRYNTTFMLSDAITRITDYVNPQNLLSAPYYKGKILGEIWGYTTVGLFQSDEDAQNWDQSYITPESWTAGDVQYADRNSDGKIDIGSNTLDDHGDLSIIGNSMPRYSFSFLLDASWKGIYIGTIWQGVGKRDLWLNSPNFWGVGWIWTSVAFEEHMDYWTEDNPDAYFAKPRMDKAFRNHQVQTRYLQSGAYLRLKSLQVAYTLPIKITQRAFIKNMKIYAVGENLLTFTKLIKCFDPEATAGMNGAGFVYPLQKNLSFGINITF
jgi:TonB-linked SusC/RagA family outer membrane protein